MSRTTKPDPLRNAEIRLIKMGQVAIGLGDDDDAYRDMLARLCNGKRSAAELNGFERRKVIDHMKANGFEIDRSKRATGRNEATAGKLRAMWYALSAAGEVEHPLSGEACDKAIESWARSSGGVPKLSSLRFAAPEQMAKLIEAMKKWCARVGAPEEGEA